VPVFRYGLDNWQADAFRLEVPASALTDPKLTDFFRNLGTALPANLEVSFRIPRRPNRPSSGPARSHPRVSPR
jgi:hypothetical protein